MDKDCGCCLRVPSLDTEAELVTADCRFPAVVAELTQAKRDVEDLKDRIRVEHQQFWSKIDGLETDVAKLGQERDALAGELAALREPSARLYRLVNNSILGVGTNAAENAEFRGALIMACRELQSALGQETQ